jgi:hypothetical protein
MTRSTSDDATTAEGAAALRDLERASWDALSTEGAAADFYARVLARHVRMLLPGGLVIDDRRQVLESMSGPPWSSYELDEVSVLPLGDAAAVVSYRGAATRDGHEYRALFNSTYVREDGEWRLALHQQTPL